MEFAQVMRSIREKNGWSLEEMARKLGTTKQALSKYERGERTPKITAAARFAEILGVPLEELIGYEYHDEEQPPPLMSEKVRLLINGINKLSPDQIEQATEMMKIMFAKTNPDLFEKGNDE